MPIAPYDPTVDDEEPAEAPDLGDVLHRILHGENDSMLMSNDNYKTGL